MLIRCKNQVINTARVIHASSFYSPACEAKSMMGRHFPATEEYWGVKILYEGLENPLRIKFDSEEATIEFLDVLVGNPL